MIYPLSDLALSRRLERCEAKANAAFAEARARIAPDVGATWIEVAGAYAMFDGAGSPLTQTFGLGVFQTPSDDDLQRLEQFFADRGAEPMHEVSPMASVETLQRLVARGYRPIELTSMLYQPIAQREVAPSRVETRVVTEDEADVWADVAAEGWGETPELSDFIRSMARVAATSEGSLPFLAELDGRAIATGALVIHDGVALLAGASTIPSARKQGAQRALLDARLQFAASRGCDLAMMGAAPGSTSQKNAERQGFRIAYTRIKWARA